MTLTGAFVLFPIFWFLILFLILPRGQATQLESGEVVSGTPGGAPAEINIYRKYLYAAIGAAVLLAITTVILEFKLLKLDDFDFLFPESFKKPI